MNIYTYKPLSLRRLVACFNGLRTNEYIVQDIKGLAYSLIFALALGVPIAYLVYIRPFS